MEILKAHTFHNDSVIETHQFRAYFNQEVNQNELFKLPNGGSFNYTWEVSADSIGSAMQQLADYCYSYQLEVKAILPVSGAQANSTWAHDEMVQEFSNFIGSDLSGYASAWGYGYGWGISTLDGFVAILQRKVSNEPPYKNFSAEQAMLKRLEKEKEWFELRELCEQKFLRYKEQFEECRAHLDKLISKIQQDEQNNEQLSKAYIGWYNSAEKAYQLARCKYSDAWELTRMLDEVGLYRLESFNQLDVKYNPEKVLSAQPT
ncbi:hypothetical protein ACQKP8_03240 [Photobacterium alginatilyticum]|uniref:DUF695 domain-containing protein n=1 Tax=Photobacterium alginatilyticum TaxID=1775171 RepID=A0ABW9YLR3_9GAMM|nr:hypothetical protein [Photobacterium alginatilyticum]NBI54630.1 hypothetical protein [Photobacterium alginatilyticum]